MRLCDDRILTTHVGSLQRPASLLALVVKKNAGAAVDEREFARLLASAVGEVVSQQIKAGIDIINDGEFSKISYSTYVTERLSGFGGQAPDVRVTDVEAFPLFAQMRGHSGFVRSYCIAKVERRNAEPARIDAQNLRDALAGVKPHGSFLTAASPGLVGMFMPNRHYASHEAYLSDLVRALRPEYETIIEAGFDLQLDCPDLAAGRHVEYAGDTDEEFEKRSEAAVEALNEATAGLPSDRMRMHICWGNYPGLHTSEGSARLLARKYVHSIPAVSVVGTYGPAGRCACTLPIKL